MDVGLMLLRVIVGALFIGHGAQKLFGWFGGHGLAGTAGYLASLGWRPAKPYAALLGFLELAGGLALLAGFGTPLAGAALAAVMLLAIWYQHRPHGLWNTQGGMEFPLVLATASVALAFTGPGRYALDHLFGWQLAGTRWGLAALLLAVAAAAVGGLAHWYGSARTAAGSRPGAMAGARS